MYCFPKIQAGKQYIVRNGTIKLANKNFTPIPNNFCINFHDDTEFIEILEEIEADNSQDYYEKSLIDQN